MTFISKALFYIRKEPLFFITLFLTLLLSLLSRPHFSAIHWNVIATLFSMMLICGAFEQCKLLDSVAELALGLFKTPRKLGFAMIMTTGLLSMFVTNDIALLTVVPLTMMMANLCGKDPLMLVILETMSANLFSAATPFGNPQNLYLYSYFHIPAGQFFKIMLPFLIAGAVLLILLNLFFNKGDDLQTEKQHISVSNHRLLSLAAAAFTVNILSVLRIIDFRISLVVTILVFIFTAPKLFLSIDYFLLLTFVLFFLFTDSVTGIPLIRIFFGAVLHTKFSVFLISAGLSQIISNVPAAVLISGFTTHYRELLYGVSAGGLGTLVASLASLISYKIYIKKYKPGRYLKRFLICNFGVLLVLSVGIGMFDI